MRGTDEVRAIPVKLRKMNEDEYIPWREWSIFDYARALIASGQSSESDARAQSELDFSQGLVNGLSTPNHHVLVAENVNGVSIGMIYYETEKSDRAFIEDFLVYEEYRQMGYGRAILTELEHILKLSGIPAVILHVFEQNSSAIKLYEKCGFSILKVDNADVGSLYMKKQL